jgi:hypothetical protein
MSPKSVNAIVCIKAHSISKDNLSRATLKPSLIVYDLPAMAAAAHAIRSVLKKMVRVLASSDNTNSAV